MTDKAGLNILDLFEEMKISEVMLPSEEMHILKVMKVSKKKEIQEVMLASEEMTVSKQTEI